MARPYLLVPTRQYLPRTGFALWTPSQRVTVEFLDASLAMRAWLSHQVAREGWRYYPPVKCAWRCGFAFTDPNLAFEFRLRWA